MSALTLETPSVWVKYKHLHRCEDFRTNGNAGCEDVKWVRSDSVQR